MNQTSTSSFDETVINFDNDTLSFASASNGTILPLWIVFIYFVLLGIGLSLNVTIIIKLLRFKISGLLSSTLQLAIVDALSIYVAVTEIWAINNNQWTFSPTLCSIYFGTEVLVNTFILYCTICINFHITSTLNLHFYQVQRDNKNPLTSNLASDESEECLVARSENLSLNRNVIIDYSRKKKYVSIIFPSILVWFVCLSLSVPQYTLSNTVSLRGNYTLCTILDYNYRELLQNLLMLFRIAIPLPLLMISLFVLIKQFLQIKYGSGSLSQNLLSRKIEELQTLLAFGICLTFVYLMTSLQRQVFYSLHIVEQEFGKISSFEMLPLSNNACSNLVNLVSAMIHYGSGLLRIVVFVHCLPELNNVFRIKKMFVLCYDEN